MNEREIILVRKYQDENITLGHMDIVDSNTSSIIYSCPTLELPWNDNKRNISCVPFGIYDIHLEYSNAFDEDLWELKGVEGRSEVKIHVANYVTQLRGCIAPGLRHADINSDGVIDVSSSRKALESIHKAMGSETRSKITIIDAF
jgi:hypothetical protein